MATTFVEYTGDGNATKPFSFPSYQVEDVKVEVDGVVKTVSTHYNITSYTTTGGGNVVFTSGNIPSSPARIRIFRDTDVDSAKATYTAGSSVKAADLNNNHKQLLFAAQEEQNQLIQTANIRDDAVTTAKIKDDNVTTAKIANDNVTMAKLGSGALPTDITVASANLVDGTIVNADVNTSAAIDGTKVTPAFGNQNLSTTGTAATGALTVTGAIAVSTTVDGRDVAADGTKLDGIESGATADQTAAEIRTLVEAATDSNVFTDADHSKLNAIESGATQDQTAAEIKTLLQSDKLTDSEIATGTLDNRYYTEAELDAGQLDNRYYTETEAEAKFLRQDSSETIASGVPWSNSDAFVATTAAINARIIDLIDEVGGFTAIANETSFPTTNPQGATGQSAILSIQAASTTLTPSGTTLTIANGAGSGNTVTVTGVSTAIPQNFGFLVESTSTLHEYSFHRLVPKATEVTTVATNITNIVNAGANVVDINNFADIYQISGSAPTQRADGTSLQEGDLWYDSSNDNLLVYTGSAFSIITPSQSVLDDVAIVSGAITYSEDLGLITDAASTGTSNGSLDIVADALEDEITFTVTVSGGKFLIDGVSAPTLTLYKGWTYTFDVSDSSNGSHPFRFYAGSSQYSTNVTVTGTQGSAGAKVQIVIPESQPTNFQYYCTNHSGMGNTITVKDDPIKTVSDNVVKIIAAADNATNINAVQANESNINAVQANASNINAAVSNASNINAVVSNATNINTVAGNNSNVTAVANNNTNITAVKNNETNINAAVSNASNINAAVSNASDISAVAANNSNITAVADNETNINAVKNNATNINAVAGNNSNITAVANNSSNINSAVSNASNINAAVANASNINSVVSNATNINTVATNVTDVNTFANRYRIGSTNPTTSLDTGDLFFNTSANELRVYNGTQWQGGVTATGNFATTAGVIFTGDNRYNDNVKAKYGDDSDLQIFHNTNDSVLNAAGSGSILLQKSGTTRLGVDASGIAVTGNIAVSGTVDGRDVATDGSKLDGIESGATGDQTASEIVALVAGQTIAPNVITTTNLTLDFGTL